MTKTVSGIPQSISTGAVDAVFMNDYIWVCGSGNTFNGSSDRSLYAVPRDLSRETFDRSDRLPAPGQKYTKMFGHSNRLYFFGGATHLINGSNRYPYVYSAVVSGANVGAFSKIADIPYYINHPYIQYTVAQDEDNNAYYVIGGQVWGNQFVASYPTLKWANGKLYYKVIGTDRNEWPDPSYVTSSYIAYGVLDSEGTYIDYAKSFVDPLRRTIGNNGDFSVVSDGLVFIQTRGNSTGTVNQGYWILKTDASGNTKTYRDYPTYSPSRYARINKVITYNNELYYCGYFNSYLFLAKADKDGNQQWTNTLTAYSFSTISGLMDITIFNDSIYAVGGEGSSNIILLKFDTDGNLLSSRTYTDSSWIEAHAKSVTILANNLYITTDIASSSTRSPKVISFDSDLNYRWDYVVPDWKFMESILIKDANTLAVTGKSALTSAMLHIDTSGNCLSVVSAPYMLYSMVSDGSNYYGGARDAVIAKVDIDGNSLWTVSRDLKINDYASDNISYLRFNGSTLVDSWSTTVPFRVFDSYSTVYDNYLYVFGGNTRENLSSTSAWAAPINPDGTLGAWSSINPLPTPGSKGDITRIGNKVFIVSGIGPAGLNLEFEGTLSSGTVTWEPASYTFPFIQRYTSLINDSSFVYSVGGWQGYDGENPVDSIYRALVYSPTITPTYTETSEPTLTPTPTMTLTHTITSTMTPTPTITPTPDQIWYKTSLTIYQGSVLMNSVSGSQVVDISNQWTWFKDGYSVFCNRDIVQSNTYLIVEKDPVLPQFTIYIKDRTTLSNVDLSSNTCTVQFTVIKEP